MRAVEDTLSRQAAEDLLASLVRTPSVNPSLAPEEAHGEAEIAALARDWLGARGVRAWLEEALPGRPNVVAEIGEAEGAPTLVLCGHLDTVGTTGMTIDPFEPRVEGGRLYGRGSYDMKGGVAAVMMTGAALVADGFDGRVLLALVADEEYRSAGAEHFVGRHRADGCILTEPSEGELILAHKGYVWLELVTRGRAAHGSRWDLGVSAIGRMGRIVAALERFDLEELRGRDHPLTGPASLHCAMISGGVELSTYAPEARLSVERRTLPGEATSRVVEEIRRVVAEAGEEASVGLLFERPPSTCAPDAPLARAVRESAAAVTGETPADGGVAYWMDAAIFAEAGIPAVDFGPAGEGAHGAVEWVDLESVVTCARVLVEAARRFCSGGRRAAPRR